jgi:hypothetical protein
MSASGAARKTRKASTVNGFAASASVQCPAPASMKTVVEPHSGHGTPVSRRSGQSAPGSWCSWIHAAPSEQTVASASRLTDVRTRSDIRRGASRTNREGQDGVATGRRRPPTPASGERRGRAVGRGHQRVPPNSFWKLVSHWFCAEIVVAVRMQLESCESCV